ncbi:MAG TPA: tetratricopeptide repeat protein [Gemmatimonadaceae bacterium]
MTETVETRWEGHNENGRRAFTQGDYAQAEQSFIAAIREATLLGADNARLATSLSNLAQLKYRQKDLAQAEALFRRSLAIRERMLGGDHVGLVQNINNLAALHYTRGELAQAEPLFRRALDISEKTLGESHPDVAVTLSNLARLYFRKNDFTSAAPLLLRLLSIKEHALGPNHPEVAAIVASLAKVRAAEGDLDAAEQLARRALASKESMTKADDPSLAPSIEALADVVAARGNHEEERQLRERAARLRGQLPNVTAPTSPAAAPTSPAPVAARKSGGAVRTERTEPRTGPVRESVTKTTTLPWIEAPTSPALRRPVPPKPPEQPMPAAPAFAAVASPVAPDVTRFTPPTAARVDTPPPRAESTAWEQVHHQTRAESHERSVEETPAGETEDLAEWTPAPRRNWVKVFAMAAALVVIGAAGWAFFMERPAADDASTVSATAGSVALRSKATQHQAAHMGAASPASQGSSPSAESARPTEHLADSHPDAQRSADAKPIDAKSPDAKASDPKPRAGRAATGDGEPPIAGIPNIDVNAVTKNMTEKAKARIDSVGRAITVKPPTFDKPKPSQP